MNYCSVLAEPLLFTMGISSLIILFLYFQKGGWLILTASSIMAGLVFLSRFSGAAFVMSAALCLMVFSHRTCKQRFLESIYFRLRGQRCIKCFYIQIRLDQRFRWYIGTDLCRSDHDIRLNPFLDCL